MLHPKRNTASIRDIQPPHKLLAVQMLVKELEKEVYPASALKKIKLRDFKGKWLAEGMFLLLHVI